MGAFQDILRTDRGFEINLECYNEKHRMLLAATPKGSEITGLVGTPLVIPASEFLAYCLFVNKRDSGFGLDSYSAIKAGLNDRLGDFNDGLALTPTSLRTIRTGDDQLAGLSEKIGVGISLSVVSRIHGLAEADWERIPKGTTKSLDFKRACDDVGYVQVEAKGTSVLDNNAAKTSGISHFAADIGEKKAAQRVKVQGVTAYGAIGTIDTKQDGVMKCFLLDPHGDATPRDHKEQRILNRLFFIAEIMETVLPQSILTAELYKRLAILVGMDSLADYANRPLAAPHFHLDNAFYRKTSTLDKDVLGVILQLRDGTRLFYGLQRQLLEVAYKQDFDALLDLRWKPSLAAESLTGWEFTGEGETNEQDQGRIGSKRKNRGFRLLPYIRILQDVCLES